ncbi:Acyl-CoA dehydrogenase, C-terminal domain [Jatrophihabitans endophyticus]|uniref:Acyl-CoA dehydrogenase, C-terminal domain n=1 Tax=Jatrophihabitans endophyticus TaxID=1206085 RepID=A0A1M5CQ08_9ACTN|nr:acyl-CoA dehydrogenase family protein [Jatrophihabitans endophyticus]SHF56820.1 Acyl-CoA dehydrogenase, C-terminal domain [Jatrophihabitans endophyticus]
MKIEDDPLLRRLGSALAAALGSVAPASPEAATAALAALAGLDAFAYERPATRDGFDLGVSCGIVVAEELGRAGLPDVYGAAVLLDSLAAWPGPERPALLGSMDARVSCPGHGDVSVASTGTAAALTTPDGATGRRVLLELGPVDAVGAHPSIAAARARHAAYLVGLTAAALTAAIGHADRRRQFGRRLAEFQGVTLPLARHVVEHRAARLLVGRAAHALDTAAPRGTVLATQALALATETALSTARTAVQTLGALGMSDQAPTGALLLAVRRELTRFGRSTDLWAEVGAAVLRPEPAQPAQVG